MAMKHQANITGLNDVVFMIHDTSATRCGKKLDTEKLIH